MKKIISSVLIIMLLTSSVMAGEALDTSKKFWSGVTSSTTGSGANPLMKAVFTVGAVAAMGVSNLVAMGIDSVSDSNSTTSIDNNISFSEKYQKDNGDQNITNKLEDGYPKNFFSKDITVEEYVVDDKRSVTITTDKVSKRVRAIYKTSRNGFFGAIFVDGIYSSSYQKDTFLCTYQVGYEDECKIW